MITQLKPEELWLTRKVAQSFFDESGLPGELNFDYWTKRWESIISELDIGAIFAYLSGGRIKGMLGGVCVPCTMTADLEAIEAFWYVMPDSRGTPASLRLLKSFEKWAKERGAVRIKMMHLSNLNADTMRDIYLRMGYEPLEVAYCKTL